jgi:hypothetical protein
MIMIAWICNRFRDPKTAFSTVMAIAGIVGVVCCLAVIALVAIAAS